MWWPYDRGLKKQVLCQATVGVACCLLGLLFEPIDGTSTFSWNVGKQTILDRIPEDSTVHCHCYENHKAHLLKRTFTKRIRLHFTEVSYRNVIVFMKLRCTVQWFPNCIPGTHSTVIQNFYDLWPKTIFCKKYIAENYKNKWNS